MSSFSFECPVCGDEVFVREENSYGEDETETCSICGTVCRVRIDSDDSEDEESGVAWVDTDDVVEDKGPCRCIGSWCGSLPRYQGGPCRWDCPRVKAFASDHPAIEDVK